jgi:hypothetical protein
MLKVSRSGWGLFQGEGGKYTMNSFAQSIQKRHVMGCDAIELPLVSILQFGKDRFADLLIENKLKCIPLLFSDGFMCPGKFDV